MCVCRERKSVCVCVCVCVCVIEIKINITKDFVFTIFAGCDIRFLNLLLFVRDSGTGLHATRSVPALPCCTHRLLRAGTSGP